MSERTDINLPALKAHLIARLEELSKLEVTTAEDRKPVELDQQSVGRLSRMDALQGQAMALETARRREAEVIRIQGALTRMETGDYGYCLSCDEDIAAKRLELDPATAICIDCAGGG